MRYIHNARLQVFLKPEEYKDDANIILKLKESFNKIMPLDFQKEKLNIVEENVEGFENRKIKILTLEIIKEAHTAIFLKTLKALIGKEQCKTLVEQKISRLDEELFFYIRLDKKDALENEFTLTDSGECIHIRMHIAAFPKNKETALKVIEQIFS